MSEPRASGAEKRRHERLSADYEVVVEIDGRQHSTHLSDISASGAFLEIDMKVKPGHDIMLLLPRADFCAKATVRRSTSDGVGLQFDDETVGLIVGGWVSANH